jgi:octaprenyl-diphosphate synthase
MKFDQINNLIQPELDALQSRMKSEMKSDIGLLNIIIDYLLKSKGKQLRPMLVFLSAKACGEANDKTIVAATMIELLHTATLVHDDVVDEADTRRGFLSINAKWKNKAAVLLGDFMLSRGLLISLENNQYELLQIMSNAVKEMSEGELLQIEKAMKLDITEAVYYDIISKKTASLIKTACLAGCHSVTEDKNLHQLMSEIGQNIGMAFQIKDDLLDLGKDDIGKPLAIDIKEQKMTLPIIYTLEKASFIERTKLLALIRFRNTNKASIQTIVDAIEHHGGIKYAEVKMNNYASRAKELLVTLPDSRYREAMLALVSYVVERKK